MVIVMYGTAIQQAIASGDLRKMKAVARQAEKMLKEMGNLPVALELLKLEIAKLECERKVATSKTKKPARTAATRKKTTRKKKT